MKGGYLREDSNSSMLARRAFISVLISRSTWCQGADLWACPERSRRVL